MNRRTMVMRMMRAFVGVLALFAIPAVRAEANTASVDVVDNQFAPQRTVIDPGATVHWRMVGNGHTITSDNGFFDFPADAAHGGVLNGGAEAFYTFTEKGVFYYHCRIHGAQGGYPLGMTGAVYVGVSPDAPSVEVRSVPDDYPTIESALFGITPGSTVRLLPGTYPGPVHIDTRGITFEGAGAAGDVVIESARDDPEPTLAVTASDLVVQHLTVRGSRGPAVAVGLSAWHADLRDMIAEGGSTGFELNGAFPVALSDFRSTGAVFSGVTIQACDPCGAIIRRGLVEHAGSSGIQVNAVSGVVVRDVTVLADNNGIGVSINSASAVDIVNVSVSGGSTSIRVAAAPLPPSNVHVMMNQVTGYTNAGLSWDLVGYDICFSGNVDPQESSGPTESPPALQAVFPCTRRLLTPL